MGMQGQFEVELGKLVNLEIVEMTLELSMQAHAGLWNEATYIWGGGQYY